MGNEKELINDLDLENVTGGLQATSLVFDKDVDVKKAKTLMSGKAPAASSLVHNGKNSDKNVATPGDLYCGGGTKGILC